MQGLIHIVKCATLMNERLCDAQELSLSCYSLIMPKSPNSIQSSLLIPLLCLQAMNTRRKNVRRAVQENLNEAVPPQAPQNPQVPIEEGVMSNVDIGSAIHSLTQVSATYTTISRIYSYEMISYDIIFVTNYSLIVTKKLLFVLKYTRHVLLMTKHTKPQQSFAQ